MPPSMRGKLRFANIFPCVSWAEKMLKQMETLPKEVQGQLAFLTAHRPFINGLIQIQAIFKAVCGDLKNNSFNELSKQTILNKLTIIQEQTHEGLESKATIFKQQCEEYLARLEDKCKQLGQDSLLCSSDIIESYFGKFKTKVNPNSRSGLTEFIFIMATFGEQFSVQEARKALESIKCKEVKLEKVTRKAA